MRMSDTSVSIDPAFFRYAILTGAHDRNFKSLITFRDIAQELIPDPIFTQLITYFCSIPGIQGSSPSCVALIDRRKSKNWNSVESLIFQLNNFFPGRLDYALVISPQNVYHRLFSKSSASADRCNSTNFELHFLDSVEKLYDFIDRDHLTIEFGGTLAFNAESWIETRKTIDVLACRTNELNRQLIESADFTQLTDWFSLVDGVETGANDFRSRLRGSGDCPADLPADCVHHVVSVERVLAQIVDLRARAERLRHDSDLRRRVIEAVDYAATQYAKQLPTLRSWVSVINNVQDYLPSSDSLADSIQDLIDQSHQSQSSGGDPSSLCEFSISQRGLDSLHEQVKLVEVEASGRLDDLVASQDLVRRLLRAARPRSPSSTVLIIDEQAAVVKVFPTGSAAGPAQPPPDSSTWSPISLPPDALHWCNLFDRLVALASTVLPKVEHQLGVIVELAGVVKEARSWLLSARTLIDDLEPDKLSFKSLDECRFYSSELADLLKVYETKLVSLTNPSLFRSRFGTCFTDTFKITELLSELDEAERLCGRSRASLVQHISQLSFSAEPPVRPLLRPTSSSSSSAAADKRLDFIKSSAPIKPSGSFDASSSAACVGSRLSTSKTCSDLHNNASQPLQDGKSQVDRYQMAWNELVDTEKTYVNFLQYVYDAFWCTQHTDESLPRPPDFMKRTPAYLLPCWTELLDFHRNKCLTSLLSCSRDTTKLQQWAEQMLPSLVDLYSSYCTAHQSACQLASQLEHHRLHSDWMNACSRAIHERELSPGASPRGCWLPLSTRLVSPIQRFQRYHLLIGHLLHLAPSEADRLVLKQAHQSFVELCELINIIMHLRDLSIRPSRLGRLLLRADFGVQRDESRFASAQQRHVLLFSHALLVTKRSSQSTIKPSAPGILADQSTDGRSTPFASLFPFAKLGQASSSSAGANPFFKVKQELMLTKIGLTPSVRNDSHRFSVWTPNRAETYTFIASDQSVCDEWVRKINELLTAQLHQFRSESRIGTCWAGADGPKSHTLDPVSSDSSSISSFNSLLQRSDQRSSSLPVTDVN